MIFLPQIALAILWSDKKFLKQMALVIFYGGASIILAYLFGMAYVSSWYGHGMPWGVILPSIMPWMVGTTSGLLIAVYAQRAIIKTEERIRDGADA